MFTGIIKSVDQVAKITPKSISIKLGVEAAVGDSVSVNGVCLTLNDKNEFDIMDETFKSTNLALLKVGDRVNIEPAIPVNGKLGGHFVTGHVDFSAKVISFEKDILKVALSAKYSRFFAIKGSAAVNGVSLTVCDLDSDSFSVSLVDFTLKNTNLGIIKVGDLVNVEVDLIARYMERMLESADQNVKFEWLKERNFI